MLLEKYKSTLVQRRVQTAETAKTLHADGKTATQYGMIAIRGWQSQTQEIFDLRTADAANDVSSNVGGTLHILYKEL